MSLYFHETMWVPPAHQSAFCKSWGEEYRPAVEGIGGRLLGMWKHSSVKGDPAEIIAMWELDNWSQLRRLEAELRATGDAKSKIGTWRHDSMKWVRQRRGKVLRCRTSSAAKQRFSPPGTPMQYCFHETMHIEPNKERDYVSGTEIQLAESFLLNNIRLIGQFQPVFETGQIINLWATPDEFDAMVQFGQPRGDDFMDGLYWLDLSIALRKHWRSVWMLPLPNVN